MNVVLVPGYFVLLGPSLCSHCCYSFFLWLFSTLLMFSAFLQAAPHCDHWTDFFSRWQLHVQLLFAGNSGSLQLCGAKKPCLESPG